MKKYNRVTPLMSDAFVIWLVKIGYKTVLRAGDILFYSHASGKNFPRNVMVLKGGRLNKPASQLFEEFKRYQPFEGVADGSSRKKKAT